MPVPENSKRKCRAGHTYVTEKGKPGNCWCGEKAALNIVRTHEREVALTPDELSKLRTETIQMADERGIGSPATFTCDNCSWAPKCKLAFDLYNTDGDCLADK